MGEYDHVFNSGADLLVAGTITKINDELRYGFIKCPKIGDVFFSSDTSFSGLNFEDLKIDQKVQIEVAETERGLFAKTLELGKRKPAERTPEASL